MLFPCPALAPISAPRRAAAGGASALLTGLISYWKLDEVSGNRSDSVGGNTLTDHNGVTSVAGVVSNAAKFAVATDQYFSHVSNAALQTGDIDFSFFGWFYLTSSGANAGPRSILGKTIEYAYVYGSTGVGSWKTANTDANDAGGVAVSYDTWHSFYIDYDVPHRLNHIQIDNGTTFSMAVTTPVAVAAGDFELGSIFGGVVSMDGRIDEVGFWKRLLTAGERTTLYGGGNGLTYPF